jgi:hypothetical protein
MPAVKAPQFRNQRSKLDCKRSPFHRYSSRAACRNFLVRSPQGWVGFPAVCTVLGDPVAGR